jgi:hypothetical protein
MAISLRGRLPMSRFCHVGKPPSSEMFAQIISHVDFPHRQLATWYISHVAKILIYFFFPIFSGIEIILFYFIFENFNKLATWCIVHVAYILRG